MTDDRKVRLLELAGRPGKTDALRAAEAELNAALSACEATLARIDANFSRMEATCERILARQQSRAHAAKLDAAG